MAKWQLQDAKARFSKVVDDAASKGPQIVTRRGVDAAVVVSIEDWRALHAGQGSTWKDVLLGEGPRFDLPLPKRAAGSSRTLPEFD